MRSEHSLKPCFNSLFQIAAGLEQALTTRISIRAEKSFKVRGANNTVKHQHIELPNKPSESKISDTSETILSLSLQLRMLEVAAMIAIMAEKSMLP